MARRKIEVIIAGDASSLNRALGSALGSTSAFEKATSAMGGNLTAGLTAAVPVVVGLTGALGALTASAGAGLAGALAVGAGGIASMAVGFGSIALVAKPAANEFKKVGKALDAYNLVLDQHAKGSKQAIAAQTRLNAVVKESGGAAVLTAVKNWRALKDAFSAGTGSARGSLFKTVNEGLGTMKSLLPTVSAIANRSMAALGKALSGPLKSMKGDEFGKTLRSLGRTFSQSIGPAVATVSNLFTAFGRIARQSGRYVVEFMQNLEGLSGKFANATKDPVALRHALAGLVSQTKAWIGLGSALGHVLFDVFRGGAGAGKGAVIGLTGALNRLDTKINSVAGKKAIHDFFAKSVKLAGELGRALGPVLQVFTQLSVGAFPAYIAIAGKLHSIMGPLTYAFVAYKIAATTALVVTKGFTTAMAIGSAAAKLYRGAMIALTAIRFGWAGLAAQAATGGSAVGKMFAAKMGAVVLAGVAGWEIGSWLRKHVPAVRAAGDAIGKALHSMFAGNDAAAFDKTMASITRSVNSLANAFKNATNPTDKNTAAIRLHIIAAKASAAAHSKVIATLLAQGATMDGAGRKSDALRAAVNGLKKSEQDAASWAATLKSNLDALPASKTITVQINTNRSGGGGAFGLNKGPKAKGASIAHGASTRPIFSLESDLASLNTARDQTQAGFDAADQAARGRADVIGSGSKNKATRKSAIADLKALNQEISRAQALGAIDIKIKGKEEAIRFKSAISDIRAQLKDAAATAADLFRTKREHEIATGPDAVELKRLQAIDKVNAATKTQAQLDHDLAVAQASYTREQAAVDQAAVDQQRADAKKLLDESMAANNLTGIEKAKSLQKDADKQEQAIQAGGQAVMDAVDAIAAYKQQAREDELQGNIDTATAAVDTEVSEYQSGLDKQLSALADNLDQKKTMYADFVAAIAALGITFTASSDQEAAVLQVPSTTPKRTKTFKPKRTGKRHRAMGGPVRAGEAYTVGEEGEETFIPNQDGRIIPHGRRSRGGLVIQFNGGQRFGSNVDVDRSLNRAAFRMGLA